jgi:hypothetical protein
MQNKQQDLIPRGAMESAMHMTDGLVSPQGNQWTFTFSDILEIWDRGCLELFQLVGEYAIIADQLYQEGYARTGDAPGVFDYEVSVEFGAWFARFIYQTGNAPSTEIAKSHLTMLALNFWRQHEENKQNYNGQNWEAGA